MNYQPTINYPETLDNNVTIEQPNFCNANSRHLVGGHVEFSVLDETYVYFFTSPQELGEIACYMQTGKLLSGLRQFIARHYATAHPLKENTGNEYIIIWNYEFDLSAEDE